MCTLLQWSCSYTSYVILRDAHSEPILDHNVNDLHRCTSSKTLSPTRRRSVILVVSDDLVMSKMFLQNPYTSSEIIDVSISLSLVVIRLGLIEVLLKWHHILINVDYIFSIFNIHTRVASRYSNDYITTQIETPFYMRWWRLWNERLISHVRSRWLGCWRTRGCLEKPMRSWRRCLRNETWKLDGDMPVEFCQIGGNRTGLDLSCYCLAYRV